MDDKGFCPECKQWFTLKNDGTLVRHGWKHYRQDMLRGKYKLDSGYPYQKYKDPCRGSGKKPVDLSKDDYISPQEFNERHKVH
jgi:hypothetical protein